MVTLYERAAELGGMALSTAEGRLPGSGVSWLGGCGEDGPVRRILTELGLADRIEEVDPLYVAQIGADQMVVPADPERWRAELCEKFPEEGAGITRFIEELISAEDDLERLTYGEPPTDILMRYDDQTVGAWLKPLVQSPEARAFLTLPWILAGLPPSLLSAARFAEVWHSLHVRRAGRLPRGVSDLVQALREVLLDAGGVIRTGSPVTRVIRRGGRVEGVVLQDGTEHRADAIAAAIDPTDLFEDLMMDPDQLQAGYPPLRRGFVTSLSALQATAEVTLSTPTAVRTKLYQKSPDAEAAYRDLQASIPDFDAFTLTVQPLGPVGPEGEERSLLCATGPVPYNRPDRWDVPFPERRTHEFDQKESYLDLRHEMGWELLERAAALISDSVLDEDSERFEGPLEVERRAFAAGGAAFGWAALSDQSGMYAPGASTTFRGLFVAGSWVYPGGSISGALQSAERAAQEILRSL